MTRHWDRYWPWRDPPLEWLGETMDVKPWGTFSTAVIALIHAFALANDLPTNGLLAIGIQESNLDPYAVNAAEGSYGVFQIYLRAHGGAPDTWLGIDGLRRSMDEMRGRWVSTFAARGGWPAWRRGQEAFLQDWAPAAQGSVPWVVNGEPLAPRRLAQANDLLEAYLHMVCAAATQRAARDLLDALTLAIQGVSDLAARAAEMERQWQTVIERYRW